MNSHITNKVQIISKGNKMRKQRRVNISSRDFWVNIVDFLQQYWALIEKDQQTGLAIVYFIHESSGVFATMEFDTIEIAEKALMQNGFKKYTDLFRFITNEQ